jgi:hypothetical protein
VAALSQARRLLSFNHLVGSHLHDQRHGKTEPLGGLEVDHELEFGGLYHRQIARLLATENAPRWLMLFELGAARLNADLERELVRARLLIFTTKAAKPPHLSAHRDTGGS